MFYLPSIFYVDNISMVGMFDECQVTSPPLCTGWRELGSDWLRPSHDNSSQWAGERGEVHSEWRLWGVWRLETGECCNTGAGETQPSGACLGPGPPDVNYKGIHSETVGETDTLNYSLSSLDCCDAISHVSWNAETILHGKVLYFLIPCVFQNWKQWLVDNHPAGAALTVVLYRRKVTLTFAQKLTTLPMNSNQHQNIWKLGEEK